ncbi:MAG TPA: DUF6089 family protein [Chitinophagaceae bacterium]|nr:DUF6089 family protein [Chitinophagaceae bacterium]
MLKSYSVFFTIILIFSINILTLEKSQAQVFYTDDELGIGVGASSYFGDLNPDYNITHPKPAVSIFYKNHVHPYISLRAMLTYTQLGYKDEWSKNPFQHTRNLSFESKIFELSALGEFNFFYFLTGRKENRFTPYLLLGISAFYYNPYTYMDSKKYHLKPLGTEGQNLDMYNDRKYSNYALALPAGFGIKYWIKPGMNLSIDFLHRFAFTDYLDDVSTTYVGAKNLGGEHPNNIAAKLADRSIDKIGKNGVQRGDRSSFDEYFIMQVSLSLQFKTYKCPTRYNTQRF